MKERIQKVLARVGVAARRKVEEMVREGRVTVNGQVMTELPIMIDTEHDHVTVDDEAVRFADKRGGAGGGRPLYILMYKPSGVLSTNVAQGEQMRVIDLLPPGLRERVYPVGRLDSQSKGLLLLTNDGDLTHRLTHPRFGVPKTYRAVVDGFVEGQTVQAIEKGIWIADTRHGGGLKRGGSKTGRCHVRTLKRARDKSVIEITLREGRNPQVRQMLAKLGHKVRDLTRVSMGPLTLKGLAIGQSRPLSPQEIRQLKQWIDRPKSAAGAAVVEVSPSAAESAT
jgi:23S rRNA pseudouridine2605 synthase